MKKFLIHRYHATRRDHVIQATVGAEATATKDDRNGFRLLGFEDDGRRVIVHIDDALVDQLNALRSNAGKAVR